MQRFLKSWAFAAGAALALGASAEPAPFMMRATVGGRTLEGQPLAWTKTQVVLLGRDGRLYEFPPQAAVDAKRTAPVYAGYSNVEMQGQIQAEFGRTFQVSTTPHFVVAHPRGKWDEWGDRLESLYRSFSHYMAVRGFRTREPRSPLVAIVFRNQDDYYAHAAGGGVTLQPGTLGHYDPLSNRIFLFDAASDDMDWADDAETIIHEATHQTAYNVGVHTRFTEQPRWIVEGLAMMFEGRGVWDGAANRTRADRINRYRLNYFRRAADQRTAGWLARLVASDHGFEVAALDSYAEAWTLTFYLCETRPQQYTAYLARAAQRETFSTYPPQERVADFRAAFGPDLELLEAQLGQFVAEL